MASLGTDSSFEVSIRLEDINEPQKKWPVVSLQNLHILTVSYGQTLKVLL